MGGNEGELDAVEESGQPWRQREAGPRWRRAWLRCGRKKTTGDRLGRDGGLGRSWAERPDGPKAEENYFRIKFWIFEYTKALEICTRKFRRNFDIRIFPKFA
jgi:hypothetical protein